MQPLSKREPSWLARLFVDKMLINIGLVWTCCCITWFHGVLCWKGGSPAICIKVSGKVLQGQKYQETIINFEWVPLWKVRKLMNETQILGSPSMDLIPNNHVNLLPYISWQRVASFAASFFWAKFRGKEWQWNKIGSKRGEWQQLCKVSQDGLTSLNLQPKLRLSIRFYIQIRKHGHVDVAAQLDSNQKNKEPGYLFNSLSLSLDLSISAGWRESMITWQEETNWTIPTTFKCWNS